MHSEKPLDDPDVHFGERATGQTHQDYSRTTPGSHLTALPGISWWSWASHFPFLGFSVLILNEGEHIGAL